MESCLKYHGGKAPLAAWIRSYFTPHTHYVEPFAGGLSVLLASDGEGISEVVNDLDGHLMNFWRVLQDPAYRRDFTEILDVTPVSERQYADAVAYLAQDAWSSVDRAVAFFIVCRQSMAGRMAGFSPLSRTRTRRGMNEQVSAWTSACDGLPAVAERLRRVVLLNRPALDVLRTQDGPCTLFYLDPPYVHATRAAASVYRHEMTGEDHTALLAACKRLQGACFISGYGCELYNRELAGWRCVTRTVANHAAGGTTKRGMTECLWFNR